MDALYDRRRDLVRLISRMKLNHSELAYQLGLAPTTLKRILRGEQPGVPPEWWGMAEWAVDRLILADAFRRAFLRGDIKWEPPTQKPPWWRRAYDYTLSWWKTTPNASKYEL